MKLHFLVDVIGGKLVVNSDPGLDAKYVAVKSCLYVQSVQRSLIGRAVVVGITQWLELPRLPYTLSELCNVT